MTTANAQSGNVHPFESLLTCKEGCGTGGAAGALYPALTLGKASPYHNQFAAAALRVGGLTPLTTVDFPGELAAVVFCQGCPWRCGYCHNGHLLPVRSTDLIPWPEVREFLVQRRGLLDAVVFSGGEPTLQSTLPATLAEVKAMGFKVGLHTAGPYPGRLRHVLSHVDWVGLDIKALPEDYPAITGIPGSGQRAWESLRLLLQAGVALQVRTTLMPGWDTPDRLDRLAERLSAAGVKQRTLQECRPAFGNPAA